MSRRERVQQNLAALEVMEEAFKKREAFALEWIPKMQAAIQQVETIKVNIPQIAQFADVGIAQARANLEQLKDALKDARLARKQTALGKRIALSFLVNRGAE